VVQGKNRYGLDMGYFSRLIAREFGDLSNFRPDEFARVCARMAATADASVLQEKEFRVTPAADGGKVELLPSVREYLQQGIDDATHCEDADQDHAFAKQLHDILNRPAQPRNEVQAEALENFAKLLELACENQPYETETYRQCSYYAKAQAARLRSPTTGGDDHE
jgi:hypothetical protein